MKMSLCCTVADSAGAVLAEVTVTFTFVLSRKLMNFWGGGKGGVGGGDEARPPVAHVREIPQLYASELRDVQRWRGG